MQQYRKMMHSPKVYLLDEGLVHALVKLCADFGIRDEIFLSMAGEAEKRLTGQRLVVHNRIRMEDCITSIADRNRHICAFDELRGTLRHRGGTQGRRGPSQKRENTGEAPLFDGKCGPVTENDDLRYFRAGGP